MLVEPSLYAVDLILGGIRYVYGFTADDDRIAEEWLYYYPNGKKAAVFERDGHSVELGSTVAERHSRSRLLESLTRDNALVLSTAVQAKQPEVAPVYRWFQADLRFVPKALVASTWTDIEQIESALARHDGLLELLQVADLGISDLRVERIDEPANEAFAVELAQIRREIDRLQDGLAGAAEERRQEILVRLGSLERRATSRRRSQVRKQLLFAHGPDAVLMGAADQSDGTIAWLNLLSLVLDALAQGGVVVVDEIDASLHPRLTARLIELFRSEATNPAYAQLIFTTHDATLLGTSFGSEILARDEIWFVEKSDEGVTSLFPLTDFHPRKDENTERRYLGGSYGAVPAVFSDTLVDRLVELRRGVTGDAA